MVDFSKVHSRKNTRSIKWDLTEQLFQEKDVLPMWIADMDFQAPKEVNEAIKKRAKHGIYGYTTTDDQVIHTITSWVKRRHEWKVDKKHISFSPSIVTSLHLAITSLTKPEDKVLIQTPVYTPFYRVIENHGRKVIKNELKLNKITNKYEIDFEHFEQRLSEGVKAFILCSPHNPVGRVWTKKELTKMAELCIKHDVLILSDEIHSDLIYPSYTHIPIATLSPKIAEQTITFMSPSKTFNIAGLQASYTIISNEKIRKRFEAELKKFGLSTLNTIGIYALEAAYNYGEKWLEQLIQTLDENKNYVIEQFAKHAPQVNVIDAEGTYLLWLDFRNLSMDKNNLEKLLIHEAKVALNNGLIYGTEGKNFMRMNIACPKEFVEKGVSQIIKALP
ncbi:MAG TPA: MalY/PatB family protein [Bacillota bacterium]|nr:MalY/PatB family protein [Bacillota bacterium]